MPKPYPGWTIAEAIERCVDPALWAAHWQAIDLWKSYGAPRSFSLIDWSDRHLPLWGGREWRAFRNKDTTFPRIVFAFRTHLVEGELASITCRGSPAADPSPCRAATWKAMVIKKSQASIAAERSNDKVEHFDVRIFPVLDAPHRHDLVAGLDLKQLFFKYVLGDPEVRARAASAMAVEPARHWVFSKGMVPGTSAYYWPLVLEADVDPVPVDSARPPDVDAALAVLMRRYRSLLSLLREVDLTGRTAFGGEQPISGSAIFVPEHHFDVETGAIVSLTGKDGQTRREVWRSLQIAGRGKPSELDQSRQAAGRWEVQRPLTGLEEAVFAAISARFPHGAAQFTASERNKVVGDWVAERLGRTASAATIKRVLSKIRFVPPEPA